VVTGRLRLDFPTNSDNWGGYQGQEVLVVKYRGRCKPDFWYLSMIWQVLSMKSTTKLSQILIHHQQLTVLLCRWILIDRQYQLYSPVGKSLSTVNINSDWSTRSINQWITIDIQIDVGTISHHPWDHDSFVDVYPGLFLITSETICTCVSRIISHHFWDHMGP